MTHVLAIECSGAQSSVALLEGDTLAFEFTMQHGRDLSRLLIPALDHSFRASGRDRSGVELVAASIGPGSFTGLRIGVTAAKTLAYALDVPTAPVSTLEALAAGVLAAEGDVIVPAVDARRGELFMTVFEKLPGGVLERRRPDSIQAVQILSEVLEGMERPSASRVIVVSPGGIAGLDAIVAGVRGALLVCEHPHARHVASIGAARAARGQAVNAVDLLPSYLRRSYAEENADPAGPSARGPASSREKPIS